MRRRLVPLLALATAGLGFAFAVPASADIAARVVVMDGSQERPLPGDPDGIGTATITLDSGTGRVCVRWRMINVDPLTAAHIHRGPAGVAGPVVVPLPVPVGSASSGCTAASPALVQSMIDNPANFYVNVHNPTYPGGALRGQLD